ncbi:hypothetical protein H1R20_g14368, partial [Candolleomyces eurysporus]
MATHFAILPEDIIQTLALQLDSNGHQYLSLPHPRTGHFALFLPTDTQILEVQAVSPTNPRSWFLDQDVIEDGKLLVMTPIDPAFLLIPLLEYGKFRTVDNIFDDISSNMKGPEGEQIGADSAQVKSVFSLVSLKCTQVALRRVCENKDLSSDTVVFRYSKEKTIQYLRRKVDRLVESKALDQSRTIIRTLARDGLMEDGRESLLREGQIKATCDLIGQYLSPSLKAELLSSYDLSKLEQHLKEGLVEEAPLKASTNTAKGKGTTSKDGDKKRKATKASHGVEQLKKANTAGMAKLSNFFTKVEKAK